MALNLMANFQNKNEHDLLADLIEEAIEQRGAVVRYIVRDMINPDYLLGEASISEFKEGFNLPMFVESVEHFNGNGDIFDAFGINKVDASIFQVGARKFRLELSEKTGFDRPREGDLIYLPFSDSLWEIEKVKQDLKYFQLGKNYTYRLVCKLFTFSHEVITDPELDISKTEELLTDDYGLRQLLGMEPAVEKTVNPARLMDEQETIEDVQRDSGVTPDSETFGF